MPHAVLLGAREFPVLTQQLLHRHDGTVHKVLETWSHAGGWVLKSLVVERARALRFLVRVDRRDDGLVVRLDDHAPVERAPGVLDHLVLVATRALEANPGARVGATNLGMPGADSSVTARDPR